MAWSRAPDGASLVMQRLEAHNQPSRRFPSNLNVRSLGCTALDLDAQAFLRVTRGKKAQPSPEIFVFAAAVEQSHMASASLN